MEEIFKKAFARATKGVMFHSQMADYYAFLGLEGFQEEQEYHYKEEIHGLRKLNDYYVKHYNKLLPMDPAEDPQAIPSSWYGHSRYDVDMATRRNAVSEGFSAWREWEAGTKKLYESCVSDLLNAEDIAGASFFMEMVNDVDHELTCLESEWLSLESSGYDMSAITESQEKLKKYFSRK